MESFLEFIEVKVDLKTKIWIVNNKHHKIEIGKVKWAGNFRKYAFFPDVNTFYDANCLEQLAAFCKEQTELHRKLLKV